MKSEIIEVISRAKPMDSCPPVMRPNSPVLGALGGILALASMVMLSGTCVSLLYSARKV